MLNLKIGFKKVFNQNLPYANREGFSISNGSKKLQLLGRSRPVLQCPPPEKLHHPKLFIGQGHYYYFPFWSQKTFYTHYMHISIFAAVAMADINGKLHHGKPILLQVFPKHCVIMPILFGFGRQVEKYKNPQNPVLV